MSGHLFYNDRKVEAIGELVTIPDNDIAKLMYYLSCVDTVINHDQEEDDILTDFQHYYLLTETQKNILFYLVLLFNPLIFFDAGVFIKDENLVPPGADNEFYQITDNKIGIHVSDQIMIGGHSVKVLKIMACNEDWLYKFYINPLDNLKRIDISQYEDYIPSNKSPSPEPSVVSSHHSYHSYHSRHTTKNCCCLTF